MSDNKEQDLKDVLREEKSRGKRLVNAALEREIRERDAAILKLIERRDRNGLEEALRLYFTNEEVQERMKKYDAIFGSD
jgi:hypothetical protein